jgi:pimeloyl-ACP methyl ester carboxylesterase
MLTSSAGVNRFSFLRWIRVKKYKILKWLINKNIISKSKIEKYGSVDYKNAKPILRKILIRVVNQNLKEYVNMINVKTVLVWDKKDTVTPYWLCKYLSKHITTAQVYLFKNGGHFTAFKNPVKFAFIINNCLVIAG